MKTFYFRACNTIILFKIMADTIDEAWKKSSSLGFNRNDLTLVNR